MPLGRNEEIPCGYTRMPFGKIKERRADMTHEEMIYRAIRGEDLKELPFVPRLDLWYQGNKLQNTLPDKYKDASLV